MSIPDGALQPLSRRVVLEGALRLVDTEGAQALTMRRLAGALGVPTMSLYGHVGSREDVLDGMSEIMVEEVELRFGETPADTLRRLGRGIRQVAHRHPAAFQLVGMRPLRTAAALRVVDAGLGSLRALGLEDETAVHAYRVLVSYVRGFALGEIATFTLERPAPSMPDPAVFPHVHELAVPLGAEDREVPFELGLELLVSGFVGLRGPAGR